MIKNSKPSRPNLDRYLTDKLYQFVTCDEAARAYGIDKTKFVRIAKQAQAIHKRHKAFVVDLAAFKVYLSEHPEVAEIMHDRRYSK